MPNTNLSMLALRSGRTRAAVAGAIAASTLAAFMITTTPKLSAATNPPNVLEETMPRSFAALVREVRTAVVNISTTTRANDMPQGLSPDKFPFGEFFGPRGFGNRGPGRALGSGFIFDEAGYIATNNHVIENATEITVILDDGTRREAELVGRDPKTDLAVLKIDYPEPLPAVSFGDSDIAEVGDWVVAVGNPFGLGGSVTAGIISARGRDIQSGPFDDFLQIDAPINRGSSGGPLFNRNGEVVGVNTAIYSPSGGNVGIGFAVPSKMAESVLSQLRDSGTIERGWIGVHIQALDEGLAESFALESTDGALVATVVPNSPAAKAGLTSGDVILRYADEPVETLKDLTRAVAATPVHTDVDVGIWRAGEPTTLTLSVEPMEDSEKVAMATPESEQPSTPRLGVSLAKVTPEIRARFGLQENVSGVMIVDVERSSPASEHGLNVGDIILSVNNAQVEEPEDVVSAVAEGNTDDAKTLLLLINRGGNQHFIAVPLNEA